MISKDVCQRVLQAAVATGADYAELFAEHSDERAISMLDSKVNNIRASVIAGAAVDVYSVEPAELSNPVFTAKNLIVTPHSAALTREGTDRMGSWCAEGCVAICNGQRWENVVDKSVYDHEKFAK